MELRTRILGRLTNDEVEAYLEHNDVILVPVGTTEMHGGFPLDSETVISEAYALKMAEAADGLVLTGLPYFYAGATASGRGTVQVSVRQGIDYLSGIAHSLLRQGFRRQIYLSFHGPAHMTICPMVRDFFDETGVPILYLDMMMLMGKVGKDLFTGASMDDFHAITLGAYKMFSRLDDVPITTAYEHHDPQSCAQFNDLFGLAYQSAAIGYCFGEHKDHMSTTAIPDEETRERLADRGLEIIQKMVDAADMPHIVDQMAKLKDYNDAAAERYPWMPSAYNASHGE